MCLHHYYLFIFVLLLLLLFDIVPITSCFHAHHRKARRKHWKRAAPCLTGLISSWQLMWQRHLQGFPCSVSWLVTPTARTWWSQLLLTSKRLVLMSFTSQEAGLFQPVDVGFNIPLRRGLYSDSRIAKLDATFYVLSRKFSIRLSGL